MRWKSAGAGLTLVLSAITLAPPRSVRADAPGASAADILQVLGLRKRVPSTGLTLPGGPSTEAAGIAPNLQRTAALSAAVITALGGRDTQFSEVDVLGDWDGREDLVADHAAKVDDLSGTELDIDQFVTRVAISEHTIANGFTENVYYFGDSVGNVFVGIDNAGDAAVDVVRQINLPTVLNAFGTLNSDDQVIVTGLAVSPVCDLTSFPNVNGSFAPFIGQIGEILYVAYEDAGAGMRITGNNDPIHSGILAFPIADLVSPATAPPGVLSTAGDPITIGGSFGVAFSVFHNIAGCAVDDDGSIYFQQVDLDQFAGANIVKITDIGSNQDRSAATNGFLTITTLNPASGVYGNASGPAPQVNRFTNYSGTSPTFGNIVALAAGHGNTLYAAVARSLVATDDAATQATEGLFSNPAALGATPAMIISFSDVSGAFDTCSSPGGMNPGTIPIGNDIADVATAGFALVAGVNNFRVFALGDGPDIRSAPLAIGMTPSNTLKLQMQIDYSIYGGLAVDEENKVYVVSGGTPAGVGRSPSPSLGEILCLPDECPLDRRADAVDLRGNVLPNPPNSGGNVGDGDSDRFDHIFLLAPMDAAAIAPTGIAGLARGFLRYTNRLAPVAISAGITLGQTAGAKVLGDDASTGVVFFDNLDPSHQVAGGTDQESPFRGDDDDGTGSPVIAGPLDGGFEFLLHGPTAGSDCVWNGFFWNSNGNVSFGAGDTSGLPSEAAFRVGATRVAGAWSNLDPSSRDVGGNLNTFPVTALGFANINHFAVRWINVPENTFASCGSRNTFTIHLYDDGQGIDENANQPLNPANPIGNNAVPFDLQEGPTDLRFVLDATIGTLVATHMRDDGMGVQSLEYGRMDLIGTAARPVLVGYSIGGQAPGNPPGLCSIDLGDASLASDSNAFRPCFIGEGTEPTVHQFFDAGVDGSIMGMVVNNAVPDFDLRFEGNDPLLATPVGQVDPSRGNLWLFGTGCALPPTPIIRQVLPAELIVGPLQTSSFSNALFGAEVDVPGENFTPTVATTICSGTGTARAGKSSTTVLELLVDTNGDFVPDVTTALTNVSILSDSLAHGKFAAAPGVPGSPFALGACGGTGNPATIRMTTTYTAGDDNVFGAFARVGTFSFNPGVRAPLVLSIAPTSGSATVAQNLTLTGDCFNVLPASTANVTSVFAVQTDRSAHVVQASTFAIVDATHVTATFDFVSADAGKTFAIHAQGPTGMSRNLRKARPGQDPGCPLGNEEGNLVTFSVTP